MVAFFTAIALAPLAYAATNVDNLIILGAMTAGGAERRSVVTGYVVASCIVLLVVWAAIFIDYLVPDELLGYLGLVTLGFGVSQLRASTVGDAYRSADARSWTAVAGLLLANSTDTIFALGPLFAESAPVARIGLSIGFALAALIWLTLILSMSRHIARSARLTRLGHRMAPWVMILVGLYILTDTGTDLV